MMGGMSCGCSPSNGSSPPAGFTTPASSSGYSGQTAITSPNCAPACPQPLTTQQITRVPYCQTWVENLFGSYAGKLIIKVGSCLHFLRSRASGWVRYDASTESVVVDGAPPYSSNVPRGTKFGYLAKTVPVSIPVLNEATGACQNTIVQEVGSQVLETRADGRLLLGNAPACGEVPAGESDSLGDQMRADYLDPLIAENEVVVSPDIGFLVEHPTTIAVGGQNIITRVWMRMRNLKLRRSQWKVLPKTDYAGAFQMVAVPVSGGDSNDPAYEMRMSVSPPADASALLPAAPNQNDTIFYNGSVDPNPNYPENQWVAYPRGLAFFPFATPRDIVVNRTTAGSVVADLPPYPAPFASGVKGILLYCKSSIGSTSSSVKTSFGSRVLGYAISGNGVSYSESTVYFNPNPDSSQITIDFVKTGAASSFAVDVSVIGFYL